eukprot:gene5593-5831_t
MDIEAQFARLQDAKAAASALREAANSCKLASFKDESLSIVEEGLRVIEQIEQQALSPNCNLLPETVGRAALKAHDALRVLQDARDGLAAALACLAESDLTDTDPTSKAGNLWVGLNKRLEIYFNCNPSSKQEVQLQHKDQAMTCATWDASTGFIWTGHADGTVLLHAPGQWAAASSQSQVGLPVRSLVIDYRRCCWVGDDAGIIRVLTMDPSTQRLTVRFQDIPQQAQWLVQRAVRQGPAAAAAAAAASGSSAAAGTPGVNSLAPINAMLSRGNALFSAGGKWVYNITLWNCQTYEPVEVHTVKSFGPTYSFAEYIAQGTIMVQFMADIWKIMVQFMGDIWKIMVKFMGGIWKIMVQFMGDIWKEGMQEVVDL